MRAFVTGGTGFLGGALVRLLRAQGHEVVALARRTSDTRTLASLGASIVPGDVTERASLGPALRGVDAVYHLAAWYELGVQDVARMEAVNVGGTRNVLETAAERGAAQIVHCSSIAALGSTDGRLADETHPHPGRFGSTYERTKHEAHEIARALAREGAPIRIALPGTIFGPADPSLVARLVSAHLRGFLRARAYAELEMSLVYVDDCARGILLAGERGTAGGEYNLVGHVVTLGEWIDRMAAVTGITPPRLDVPRPVVRAAAAFFPLVAPLLGLPAGTAREALRMGESGSWAFSSARARRELGWETTDLDVALARTLTAFDARGGRHFRPQTENARRALSRIAQGATP